MMYPNITIASRVSSSGKAFSVEVRHDDEGDWETYFRGDDKAQGIAVLNDVLGQHPNYPLYVGGREVPVQGYLFTIKYDQTENPERRRFFRTTDEVRNPFVNRKMYAVANPKGTASFRPINI